MTQHTKGPWVIKKGVIQSETGEFVGNLYAGPSAPANATLIAESPNLLYALECTLQDLINTLLDLDMSEDEIEGCGAVIKARAAMAKARGES